MSEEKKYPFIEYVAREMAKADDSTEYWEEYQELATAAIKAVKIWFEAKQ